MTVFIRITANLAQLLPVPKPSRTSAGNEKIKNVFWLFLGPLKNMFFRNCQKLNSPN
jgi:hypothetical protein